LRRAAPRLLATVAFAYALTACGESTSLDVPEKLEVVMLGSFTAPADAAGNAEPRHQTYTLVDVAATAADGTIIDLYEEDAKELKIINRSQIIHEADLADYVDTAFTQISVQFDPTVKGLGKIEEELTVTLPAPTLTLLEGFTVDSAAVLRLTIEAQWKNTITRDEELDPPEVMSAPTFVLELKGG